MLLYHGTSARRVPSILADGLLPRHDAASNWGAASCAENVYLTSAYGIYFAQNARFSGDEGLALVEIDTDLLDDGSRLVADEDALAFLFRSGQIPRELGPTGVGDLRALAAHYVSRLREMAAEGYGHQTSLALLGNCSHYGAIPVEAITRVVTFSAEEGPWWLSFHDPLISPLNFRIHGSEYVAAQFAAVGRMDEARSVPQFMPGLLDVDLDMVEAMCAPRRTIVDLVGSSPRPAR